MTKKRKEARNKEPIKENNMDKQRIKQRTKTWKHRTTKKHIEKNKETQRNNKQIIEKTK